MMVDPLKHVGTTDFRNNFYFFASSLCRTLRFTIARLMIYAEKHEKLQVTVAIFPSTTAFTRFLVQYYLYNRFHPVIARNLH